MFCKSATCGWLTFVLSRWKKRTSKLHVWRIWNSRSGRKEMVNPMDVFYSYMIYYKSDIYIYGAHKTILLEKSIYVNYCI